MLHPLKLSGAFGYFVSVKASGGFSIGCPENPYRYAVAKKLVSLEPLVGHSSKKDHSWCLPSLLWKYSGGVSMNI
jgi:hypothetical protein